MLTHAAITEIVWVLVASTSFTMNLFILIGTIRVSNTLNQLPDSTQGERILAIGHIRHEAFRCGKQGVILLAGVAAVWLPPPPPDLYSVPQTAISACGFIIVSLLMLTTSVSDALARKMAIDTHFHGERRHGWRDRRRGGEPERQVTITRDAPTVDNDCL